jgi:hypothetical protein
VPSHKKIELFASSAWKRTPVSPFVAIILLGAGEPSVDDARDEWWD